MARFSGNLSADFLDTLRDQADIVRTVSDYVSLKKVGRSWKGLCPFHREKTPSFHVDEEKGLFFCFGCREGGDLFAFVMKMEGLSFPEAVRAVAERAGVEVPSVTAPREEDDLRSRLLAINSRAADWYRRNLWAEVGSEARKYLKARGLDRDTLESFSVGYAPGGWEGLLRHLRRDHKPTEIEAAGLALARRSGQGHYDRFRNRIMFPIRDLRGRVLGFGGRVLPGDDAGDQPKYLNTPETPVYHKGRVLYGMEQARGHARNNGEVILVEGYTDVLGLHRHGFAGAVGVCGTALTTEHASLLHRFAKRVFVNFDADAAGRTAAVRGLELLLEAELDVRAVLLPAGEDPASFLDREGPEGYQERLDAAEDLLAFFLEGAAQRGDQSQPQGKVRVVEEVLPLVARVPDRILRSEFASRLAARLRIEDQVILERVRQAVAAGRDRLEDRARGGVAVRERLTDAESGLLQAILGGTETELLREMETTDFEGLGSAPIFREVLELRDAGREPNWTRVLDRLSDERAAGWVTWLAGQPAGTTEPRDCLQTLRRMQIERRLRRVQHDIDAAEKAGDNGAVDRLAMEKLELKRQMSAL